MRTECDKGNYFCVNILFAHRVLKQYTGKLIKYAP